jgi:hypothetical protein
VDDLDVKATWKHRTAPGVYQAVNYGCGDVNSSGSVDIDDAVYLICHLFLGAPQPEPYWSGDVDCGGWSDLDDVVYLVSYILNRGTPPCDTDGNGTPDC